MRPRLTPRESPSRQRLVDHINEHSTALDAIEDSPPIGFAAFNGDSVPLLAGMPVCTGATSGSVRRGAATSQASSSILGLVVVGADVTLTARVLPDGALALDPAAWSAIVAEPGGLIAGARYYLGTIGTITATPSNAPGDCITALGRALSTSVLVLHIQPYIVQ